MLCYDVLCCAVLSYAMLCYAVRQAVPADDASRAELQRAQKLVVEVAWHSIA